MALHNMGDLMCHDACKLGLIVGSPDCAHIDVNRATRQRKGIDRFYVNHMEVVRPSFSRRMRSQFTAQALDIPADRV